MANDTQSLKDRIKILEVAKSKLSREWFEVEREKTKLLSAIENLPIGFLILDDYNKITLKNSAACKILGVEENKNWTVDEFQNSLGGDYDLKGDITICLQERVPIGPKDIKYGKKTIRIFISPIIILKKSLTVPGSTILIE